MPKPYVEVKNLKKYFETPGGMLHAVDGLNFAVDKGQTIGIVGESGCGKSTMGRVMARLIDATDGEVLMNGQNVLKLKGAALKDYRKRVQIIFQDPFSSLNPRKTVYATIAEPLLIHKVHANKQSLENRVLELIELVGLSERHINSYPHELDGGRRQRIGIARALALNPEFIVCDEPVSALDVSIQAQILNLLKRLQQQLGLTYMFITHDLSVVRHVSNDILVMYLGEMVEKAPARKLFAMPHHPYTQALLSAIPVPSLEKRPTRILLRGEITSPINPKEGCRFADRCNFVTEQCRVSNPPVVDLGDGHLVRCWNLEQTVSTLGGIDVAT